MKLLSIAISLWIRPFHNSRTLIRFTCDSWLSLLHSGRWVTSFDFTRTALNPARAIDWELRLTTTAAWILSAACRLPGLGAAWAAITSTGDSLRDMAATSWNSLANCTVCYSWSCPHGSGKMGLSRYWRWWLVDCETAVLQLMSITKQINDYKLQWAVTDLCGPLDVAPFTTQSRDVWYYTQHTVLGPARENNKANKIYGVSAQHVTSHVTTPSPKSQKYLYKKITVYTVYRGREGKREGNSWREGKHL